MEMFYIPGVGLKKMESADDKVNPKNKSHMEHKKFPLQ